MKAFRLSGNNSHSIGDTGSDLGQENLSICRKIGPCISKNRLKYYEYFQFCQPSNKLSFLNCFALDLNLGMFYSIIIIWRLSSVCQRPIITRVLENTSSQIKMIFKFLFFASGICFGSARSENELERSARSIFIDKVVIENSSDEFIRVYIEARNLLSLLKKYPRLCIKLFC